jgi:hypothetical protein
MYIAQEKCNCNRRKKEKQKRSLKSAAD